MHLLKKKKKISLKTNNLQKKTWHYHFKQAKIWKHFRTPVLFDSERNFFIKTQT